MKRLVIKFLLSVMLCVSIFPSVSAKAPMPDSQQYTNSLGMKFVRIESGSFKMGQIDKPLPPEVLPLIEGGDRGGRFDLLANGDYDEKPIHQVQISRPFYMSTFEVTNKQYELFDPDHRRFRGKHDLSSDDDEAVIYVSWYDAMAFCEWLSNIENLPYRLPTEAEWEYSCRAGTTSNYYTGDILPAEYEKSPSRDCLVKADLQVGQTPANHWGLYDMHGNVEEWCMDWYGPYVRGKQTDPTGYNDGDFKVSRGGSFGTFSYYLRSANRMATLPEERQWATGFRVVIGPLPRTKPLINKNIPLHQQNVIQREPVQIKSGPDADVPYFYGPRKFVIIDRSATGPVFAGHNHSPFIIACPNGDLLANWFTCVSEKDREMARAGSRLRWGNDQWDKADVFWDTPDRNDSVAALWFDGKDTLYNLMGIDVGSTYSFHSLGLRTSKDSGATWSKVRIFNPEHVSPNESQDF